MTDVVAFVQSELRAVADTEKAAAMLAYMKTDLAFYGVQKPGGTKIMRQVKAEFPPSSDGQYVERVLDLWVQPHREEKYIAIAYAQAFGEFVTLRRIDLYVRLIREGAW